MTDSLRWIHSLPSLQASASTGFEQMSCIVLKEPHLLLDHDHVVILELRMQAWHFTYVSRKLPTKQLTKRLLACCAQLIPIYCLLRLLQYSTLLSKSYLSSPVRIMASQNYPQTVNLDEAKARPAELQSETSKAQGGNINPNDPASKARVCLPSSVCKMHACVANMATHSARTLSSSML